MCCLFICTGSGDSGKTVLRQDGPTGRGAYPYRAPGADSLCLKRLDPKSVLLGWRKQVEYETWLRSRREPCIAAYFSNGLRHHRHCSVVGCLARKSGRALKRDSLSLTPTRRWGKMATESSMCRTDRALGTINNHRIALAGISQCPHPSSSPPPLSSKPHIPKHVSAEALCMPCCGHVICNTWAQCIQQGLRWVFDGLI